MLNINDKAIDFSLKDENGVIHTLSQYLGKKVVLYFYPKDNTSGCTQQAVGFKQLYEEFSNENAIIIGISKDSTKSHLNFKTKYELPFILLSDESLETIQAYGVWKEKSMYGKKYMGIERSTFIINEEGIVVSIERKVNPKDNPSCSLKIIRD